MKSWRMLPMYIIENILYICYKSVITGQIIKYV